jgi:hypothetical protein
MFTFADSFTTPRRKIPFQAPRLKLIADEYRAGAKGSLIHW